MAVIGRILCYMERDIVAPKTTIIGPPIGTPQAILCYNLSDGCNFIFDASGSISGVQGEDSSTLEYQWDMGDGTVYPFQLGNSVISHSYTEDGTYTVKVTVKDGNGNLSTATSTVTFTIKSPLAVLSFSLIGDCNYRFDASQSLNNGCSGELAYFWEFGDGDTSDEVSPTHAYANNGSYSVRLTVTNTVNNRTSVATKIISVSCDDSGGGGNDLLAVINYSADESTCIYNFDGTQSVNEISYYWDFGNGQTSTAASPTHTFSKGSFVVSLTVTDLEGNTDTTSVTVVCDPPAPILIVSYSCGNNGCGFNLDLSKSINNVPNETVNDLTFQINWGDSTELVTVNPGDSLQLTHTYAANGTYTITITVVDSNNKSDLETLEVTANCVSSGQPPVAVQDSPTVVDNKVTLDGQPSYAFDTDNEEDEYKWTLMNPETGGIFAETTFLEPDEEPDDTQDKLDGDGAEPCFDALEAYTFLCNDAPIANFVSVQGSGGTYTFNPTGSSANGCVSGITEYKWTFYDITGTVGDVIITENPSYTYTKPGKYAVVLRVTTDCGEAVFTNFVDIIIEAGAIVDAENINSILTSRSGGPAGVIVLDIDGDGNDEYTSAPFSLPVTTDGGNIPHTGVQTNGSIIGINVYNSLNGDLLDQDLKRRPTPESTLTTNDDEEIFANIGFSLKAGNAITINTSGSKKGSQDIASDSNYIYFDTFYKGTLENDEMLFAVQAVGGSSDLIITFGSDIDVVSQGVIETAILGTMDETGYFINKEVIFDALYANTSIYQGHPHDKRFNSERLYTVKRIIADSNSNTKISDPVYVRIGTYMDEETNGSIIATSDSSEKADVIYIADAHTYGSAIRALYRSSGYVETLLIDYIDEFDQSIFIGVETDEESAIAAGDTVRIYAMSKEGSSGASAGGLWEGTFNADNSNGTVNITWVKVKDGLGDMSAMKIHSTKRLNNRPIIYGFGESSFFALAYDGADWVKSSDNWFSTALAAQYPGKATFDDAVTSFVNNSDNDDIFIAVKGYEDTFKNLGVFRVQFGGTWTTLGDVTTIANYAIVEVVIDFNDQVVTSGTTILGTGNAIAGLAGGLYGLAINPEFSTRNGKSRLIGTDVDGSGLVEILKYDDTSAGDSSDYVLNLLHGKLNNIGSPVEDMGRDGVHSSFGNGSISKVETNVYLKPEGSTLQRIKDLGAGVAGYSEFINPSGISSSTQINLIDNKTY